MYVANTLNALNDYPHQLRFEPIRDADCVGRHNWSPGYYEDADAVVDHHICGSEDDALVIAPAPTAQRKEQATDGELEMADAS